MTALLDWLSIIIPNHACLQHKRMSILCFEGLNATIEALMNIVWCYSYSYVGGIILSVLSLIHSFCFGSLWQMEFLMLTLLFVCFITRYSSWRKHKTR